MIKDFISDILVFLRMRREGFYFAENVSTDKDGSRWGFYRLCKVVMRGEMTVKPDKTNKVLSRYIVEKEIATFFDIDFSYNNGAHSFFHVHGDDYRWDRPSSEPS